MISIFWQVIWERVVFVFCRSENLVSSDHRERKLGIVSESWKSSFMLLKMKPTMKIFSSFGTNLTSNV